MKLFFACLLALIHVAPLLAADQAAPITAIEVQKAFKVIAHGIDNKTTYTATAFYVGPTTLATAAHTFKKTNDRWIEKDGRRVHCKLAKIDFKIDLAILECEETNAEYYKLVNVVKVIGFPMGGAMETNSGQIDSERVHVKVRFLEGMSGSPVVNEHGEVEGVGVQHDLGKDGSTCRFIPASVLAAFMAKK
jgi:V8-like Glu-specific endopeptidase